MRITQTLPVLAGFLISATAGAVSWDTGSPPSIAPTSGSIWCNETGTCNTTGGLSGSVIKMTAYSTATRDAAGGNPVDTGNWVAAQIAMYSGGIGITNNQQTSAIETGAPQHAIDNRGVNDILVIDFGSVDGSSNWDVSSFTLGYTCVMAASNNDSDFVNNTTTSICPTSGGNVNADAWLGGAGSMTFTSVQFSGGVPTGGFTQLMLTPDIGGQVARNNLDTGTGNTGSVQGRYLIIAGALAENTDAFKVSGFSATQVTPPPPNPNQVPLPGSASLVVFGLFALTWVSRRRVVARR